MVHHQAGALVIGFVEGRTLSAEDFAQDAMLAEAVDLVARAHRDSQHFRGPAALFSAFQVLRDYAARLREEGSGYRPALGLRAEASVMEAAVGPADLAFGHNDLLPGEFHP